MPQVVKLSDDVITAAEALKGKLSGDEEGVALVLVLVGALNQVALLYQDSEERHGANVSGANSVLSGLRTEMQRLQGQLDKADSELRDLHGRITSTLDDAAQDIGKAKTAMRDVLNLYSQFSGNVDKLKAGVVSLAKSSLVALNPGLGAWAAPLVDSLVAKLGQTGS